MTTYISRFHLYDKTIKHLDNNFLPIAYRAFEINPW